MHPIRLLSTALALWAVTALSSPAADEEKRPLPDLTKVSAADFIKRYDKNGDGNLTKDELPEFLSRGFERADANSDGKLDAREVEQMLSVIRQRAGNVTPDADRIVNAILERHDANKDGKITKEEAKDRLADNFARVDRNGDGVIDKEELKEMIRRLMAFGGRARPGSTTPAPRPPQGPDFDTLDKNADGRLTADELQGTPLAEKFAEIDTNGDQKIDPREFEAFLKKQ